MIRRIEFSPVSPFHDLEGFKARVRAAHPTITERGLAQLIQLAAGGRDPKTKNRSRNGYNPRHPSRVYHLFGDDVMTADLMQIPAWPWIAPGERVRLLDHPITGGEVISPDAVGTIRRMLQEELANRLDRKSVNRSALISPPGLTRTYVWCLGNGWMQDVEDADYDLILSSPGNRRLFRDPDIFGLYQDVRSFNGPGIVTSRTEARSAKEAEYLMRQTKHQPNWQGADLESRTLPDQ